MTTLTERAELAAALRPRVAVALAAALTDVLLETASTGTDDDKKRRRIKQRWALRALNDLDRHVDRVVPMIASKAPEGMLADGLDDDELVTLVGQAVDAIAGVELLVVDETLPAP